MIKQGLSALLIRRKAEQKYKVHIQTLTDIIFYFVWNNMAEQTQETKPNVGGGDTMSIKIRDQQGGEVRVAC